jgi:hypothetical protein
MTCEHQWVSRVRNAYCEKCDAYQRIPIEVMRGPDWLWGPELKPLAPPRSTSD